MNIWMTATLPEVPVMDNEVGIEMMFLESSTGKNGMGQLSAVADVEDSVRAEGSGPGLDPILRPWHAHG